MRERVLNLLSAGAAQGLVERLQQEFQAKTGARLNATFGAVGAMRAKLEAGAPCDVIILSDALIDALAADGRVLAGTRSGLGRVRTGIAARAGEALPQIATGPSLLRALRSATGIYLPDPKLATAGIHFVKVLEQLGVGDEVAPRIRAYPNGATAMRELARANEPGLMGCTQITEIKNTAGVALAGPLPPEFELITVYTAATCAHANAPDVAAELIACLAGPESRRAREDAGFE
jgi:molybdate transport system substrate-binding protein